MTYSQQAALQKFIEKGNGWVGIHAAGLTGREFLAPNTIYWNWFEKFMGGITYSPHPYYQKGMVIVEDRRHPATKNLPIGLRFRTSGTSSIKARGEPCACWPRGRIELQTEQADGRPSHSLDQRELPPNDLHLHRPRPTSLQNPAYVTLLRDSILWAGS